MSKSRVNTVYEIIVVGVSAIALFAMQHIVGEFPVTLFRFPLNILVAALWCALLVGIYRKRSTSRLSQALLSMRATILSLSLIITLGIVLGLQAKPHTESWPVVGAILFVLSHLVLITIRGARDGQHRLRIRFLLNHLGLILAIGAGFWGAPDREELRVIVESDKPTNEAYRSDGKMTLLDYNMQLSDFDIEYYDTGTPSAFKAGVVVDGREQTLRVNHPYNRTLSETIYLISYDTERGADARYCIVEVVREPWRWLSVAGIVMLMAGAVLMFIQGKR